MAKLPSDNPAHAPRSGGRLELTEAAAYEYPAFISYRHIPADRAAAKWLIESVESYRVPRDLQRRFGLPARLGRLFRDEDELPSSADLNDSILHALRSSRMLIAVCSPALKDSKWCCKEIQLFREWDRPVLALIIDGDPTSRDPDKDPFTDEIRTRHRKVRRDDGRFDVVVEEAEPIAADLRPRRGMSPRAVRHQARLKLVAALLEIPFGVLKDREKRRQRNRRAIFGTSSVALSAMLTIALVVTIQARGSARETALRNLASTLAGVVTTSPDLSPDLRALLAAEAFDIQNRYGGDLPHVDQALRLSVESLSSLAETIYWQTAIDIGTRLPIDGGAKTEQLGQLFAQLGWASSFESVAFSPDSRTAYLGLPPGSQSSSPVFAVWDYGNFTEPTPVRHRGSRQVLYQGLSRGLVASSPTGRIAYAYGREMHIQLQEGDPRNHPEFSRIESAPNPISALVFDPSSTSDIFRVAYGDASGNLIICFVDIATGTDYDRATLGSEIHALAFAEDGTSLFIGFENGRIQQWSMVEKEKPRSLVALQESVNAVAVHPDGHLLAVAHDEGMLVLSIETQHVVYETQVRSRHDRRAARDIEFSDDGKYLAIGWGDGGRTGLHTLTQQATTDKRGDGYVHIYQTHDLVSHSAVNPIILPTEMRGITALAFSPCSELLVATSDSLTAHTWIVPTELIAQKARRLARRTLTQKEWDEYVGSLLPYRSIRVD